VGYEQLQEKRTEQLVGVGRELIVGQKGMEREIVGFIGEVWFSFKKEEKTPEGR